MDTTTNTANAPTGAAPQNLFLASFAFVFGLLTKYIAAEKSNPPQFVPAGGGPLYRLLDISRDGTATVETSAGPVYGWRLHPGELSQCALYVMREKEFPVEMPEWAGEIVGTNTRAAGAGANISHDAGNAGLPPHYGETQKV